MTMLSSPLPTLLTSTPSAPAKFIPPPQPSSVILTDLLRRPTPEPKKQTSTLEYLTSCVSSLFPPLFVSKADNSLRDLVAYIESLPPAAKVPLGEEEMPRGLRMDGQMEGLGRGFWEKERGFRWREGELRGLESIWEREECAVW